MTHTTQVLSDEQIDTLRQEHTIHFTDLASRGMAADDDTETQAFARAIESATLKAVSGQEPAYYIDPADVAERVDSPIVKMASEWHEGLRFKAPLYTLPPAQPAPVDERVAWAPYLVDRADGVKGHYAIGRWNPRGYREVWNLHYHTWSAFSDDVMSLEEADSLMRQITIPTARAALQGAQAPQAKGDEQ